MTKYILYTGFAFSLFFASCSKKLDINPQQQIDQDDALTTDDNVKKALKGAYNQLSNSYVLGGDMQLYSELLAANGEIAWEGTFNQPDEVYQKSILTNNSFVTNTWLNAYASINTANAVLASLDVVDEDDRDAVKGEALFIRGTLFFELVKLYALPYSAGNTTTNLGIPLRLTYTSEITEDSYLARSTVEESYQQIIEDLTSAESLLPSSNDVYATKSAAAAELSRVYLQTGAYDNALSEANNAISNFDGSLTTTYAAAFNNTSNSTEDIFALQVSDQDGDNDMNLFWSTTDYGGRDGDVSIQQKHLNLYESGDARLAFFWIGNDAYRSGKWQYQYRNLPLIRLAEMYLTRAECNFRLGSAVGATPLADINNVIRSRVGLTALSTLTLDTILKERKLELAHEGHAVHDLKRLKESADGYAYDAAKMVFPIPLREINASNGALVQNSGYGSN
ncbi:MAG: RagB/SusD family nutrient uptake outer membrane protein [Chitinophagaceae bacterium]